MFLCTKGAIQEFNNTPMPNIYKSKSFTQTKSKGQFKEQKVPPLKYSACISSDKVISSSCSSLELVHATFLIQLQFLPLP
jgi:hypothetical protein